jgi:hypothetical protein
MKFSRILSLGPDCQPAFRIRRHTGHPLAYYFDWIETPHAGLIRVLNARFENAFRREDLYISSDRKYVENRLTGIRYYHLFTKNPPDDLLEEDILSREYDKRSTVLAFLAAEWLETVSEHATLHIRQCAVTHDQALELYEAVASCSQGARPTLLYVTPPGEAIDSPSEHIYIVEGPRESLDPDERARAWRGDYDAWSKIFGRFI